MKRSKKLAVFTATILTLGVFLQVTVLKAQVGINQPNPDSSAVLDLKSNNRGVLMPRLEAHEIQSIKNPSKGLMLYCSDLSIFCYFDGAQWLSLPSWVQKLDLADPAGGIQDINAILNANSKVGIGTDTPASKLTVLGNLTVGEDTAATANGAYIKGKVKIGAPPDAGDTQQLEVDGGINAEGSITATGNINTTGKVQEDGNDLLPSGAIIMWSGTSPPAGWALCDGGGGRPDLRGRFIVGYENRTTLPLHSDTLYKGVKNTGGEKTHALIIDEMPTHDHSVYAEISDHYTRFEDGDLNNSGTTEDGDNRTFDAWVTRTIDVNTGEKGGGDPHENRPPYYVLAFIIKL